MLRLKTIDAHAAGEPLRLIVDGFPAPRGRTMLEKREWVLKHADHLRRALMLEPRGHADMYGALFTEPVSPGSHAGVLFMHNEGYSTMCGHGVVAVTTIALERGLLMPGGDGAAVVYDSPAGTIRARARLRSSGSGGLVGSGKEGAAGSDISEQLRVESVAFVNVPSFVLHAGLPVMLGSRQIRADVAFGGEFYAIVDAESACVPVNGASIDDLRKIGSAIAAAIDDGLSVRHPLDPSLSGVAGTVFTSPPQAPGADLRSTTVYASGSVDRSPGGTAMAAVMAVLDAMGMLTQDGRLRLESLTGQIFEGRLAGRTQVGAADAVVAEISGAAYITGEHTFTLADGDPFAGGFSLRP